MEFTAVILAAGKGTRMKSSTPKVLHNLCGRPMIAFPIEAAKNAGASQITVVVDRDGEEIKNMLENYDLTFAVQKEQLGTGHAVISSRDSIKDAALPVVILCGDAPLIKEETIAALVETHMVERNSITVLTGEFGDPAGYGRIVRSGDDVMKIVEERDASPEEKNIKEINSGIYCVDGAYLFKTLERVDNENDQGEYYLTDIVGIAKEDGKKVGGLKVKDIDELMGINSRKELAVANSKMGGRIIDRLMSGGVTFIDPDCSYIDACVKVESDAVIYPMVRLEGSTVVSEKAVIESGCVISNSQVGAKTHIKSYSVVSDSVVNEGAVIGPFAHLRPGSIIKEGAKVGNFVELKKTVLGRGSKANHLSYIGDSEVGEGVNIGAGTITCNYDGYNKFRTTIENGAFIGSGTNLVAPVTIGSGATLGAGSTITKDVPTDSLSLTRTEQKTITGWSKKRRESRGGK